MTDLDIRISRVTTTAQKRALWELFAPHHYLSPTLNVSAACFLAELPDGTPVAFTSAITMPSGTLQNAWREHRTVVLPDYQGFGVGLRLVEWTAEWHRQQGRRFYSRTTHPRIGQARDASASWRATKKSGQKRNPAWSNATGKGSLLYQQRAEAAVKAARHKVYVADTTRVAFSHEYVGLREVL